MKQTIHKLVALALMLGTSAAAFGDGLLGQNYFGAGLGYARVSVPGPNWDGYGVGALLNQNLMANDSYGVDLTGEAAILRVTGGGDRFRSTALTVGANAFTMVNDLKPFVGVFTGWSFNSIRGLDSTDGWLYGFNFGLEIPFEGFTVTPVFTWTRDQDAKESLWSAGIQGHYWFSETMGLGLSYSASEGPNRVQAVTALLTVRY